MIENEIITVNGGVIFGSLINAVMDEQVDD